MKKLKELNELELNKYFEDKQTKIRLEKIEKKNETVFHIQELYKAGVSIREISRQTDIDRRTVKNTCNLGLNSRWNLLQENVLILVQNMKKQ